MKDINGKERKFKLKKIFYILIKSIYENFWIDVIFDKISGYLF